MAEDYRAGIVEAAHALGMTPLDLATIISYESGFDANVWGGDRGRHFGLIQFGPNERAQYGVDTSDPMSQLGSGGAIVKYMKDRGFKPGMDILDAYSTVNAGQPGLYNASDTAHGGQPGNVRDKVENQFGPHRRKAEQYLGEYLNQTGSYDTAREDTPSYSHPTSDTFRLPKVDTNYGAGATYGDSPSETGGARFGGTGLGTPATKGDLLAEKSPWAGGGDMPPIPQQPAYQLTPQPAATVAKAQAAPIVNVEQQQAQRQQLAQLLAQLNAPLQQRQQV
jgi:hypothetical protein